MEPHNVHILVVDDDHRTCAYISRILSKQDWKVDAVTDSSVALQFVQQKKYDAVVLDYRMPGMDGAELCRRIREIQPAAREVFLTGFPTIDTVYPAIQAGGECVLSKPVDPKELVRVLEEQLAQSAARNPPGSG